MSRLMKALAVAFISALMLVMMVAPAFAFHHLFLPANDCGESTNPEGSLSLLARTTQALNRHCRRQIQLASAIAKQLLP